MNWLNVALGTFALCYGVYTIYARLHFPGRFGKLEAMQKMYGRRAGTLVHVVSYTIVPLIFGAVMIVAGVRGVALFD